MAKKAQAETETQAVAAREFIDSHTGKKYAEGEALTGPSWSDERIAKYVAKGIARIAVKE